MTAAEGARAEVEWHERAKRLCPEEYRAWVAAENRCGNYTGGPGLYRAIDRAATLRKVLLAALEQRGAA